MLKAEKGWRARFWGFYSMKLSMDGEFTVVLLAMLVCGLSSSLDLAWPALVMVEAVVSCLLFSVLANSLFSSYSSM